MAEEYRNFIAGEWVAAQSGRTFENRNPANAQDLIGTFPRSDKADLERAVAGVFLLLGRGDGTPLYHFTVVVDGRPVPSSAWGSRQARLVCKRLAVAVDRHFDVEAVTLDELWSGIADVEVDPQQVNDFYTHGFVAREPTDDPPPPNEYVILRDRTNPQHSAVGKYAAAKQGCPVSKALAGVEIVLDARLA